MYFSEDHVKLMPNLTWSSFFSSVDHECFERRTFLMKFLIENFGCQMNDQFLPDVISAKAGIQFRREKPHDARCVTLGKFD